jgi:hypothetical protein
MLVRPERSAIMYFESASPSIVKSIRQVELLNTWLRLFARNEQVPRLESFQPERISEEMSDLIYYDVVVADGKMRFLIRRSGAHLAKIFGGSGEGRFLDDFIAPILAKFTLPIYLRCVERRLPAYSVCMVDDLDGRKVAYERLLLPFSNGTDIVNILGSFKAISEDGRFELRNLMRDGDDEPTYLVRAIIDQNLVYRRPGRGKAGDIIDF